jgi:sulfite exporter TauE/SafE
MSWRDAPQSAVTLQVLSGVLLVCLGLLLGTSWTIQALQPTLRRQAEERRKLNEEWTALRTARQQRNVCPRCGGTLAGWSWYTAPIIVEDPPDDD